MSQSKPSNSTRTERWLSLAVQVMERNPRRTLILMFVILAVSIVAVTFYSVSRKPPARQQATVGNAAEVPDITGGIMELWRSGAAVTEAMRIEREISRILEKEKLTAADSLDLVRALEQLQATQQKLKPANR